MSNHNENEAGTRIKMIRQALNMRQQDFADEMGVSGPSLSEIENNKYKPGFNFLVNLYTRYSVNIYYVMFGQGDMFIDPQLPRFFDNGKKYWVNPDEVRSFLYYFEQSRLFQYEVMADFRKKFMKTQDVFDKDIESSDKKKSDER
ncbi:MAG: helix-turn-helix transcriptional regulator [bacterium]|nr:helix-turn-helix transcriptional regulator [bacterium]